MYLYGFTIDELLLHQCIELLHLLYGLGKCDHLDFAEVPLGDGLSMNKCLQQCVLIDNKCIDQSKRAE